MPHIHDLIDFTVEVFIVHKDKVLLRKHDKYGIWLSIGGHIELDEDPNQAALREVKEEVGLEIELFGEVTNLEKNRPDYQELIVPTHLNRHRINPNHEHVTLVYFAAANTDELKLTESEERSEDCRWFKEGELDSLQDLSPTVKSHAKEALEKLSGN